MKGLSFFPPKAQEKAITACLEGENTDKEKPSLRSGQPETRKNATGSKYTMLNKKAGTTLKRGNTLYTKRERL